MEFSERTTPERLIGGTACGSSGFPTPTTRALDRLTPKAAERFIAKNHSGNFAEAMSAKMWPTPNASDNRPRATEKSTARRVKIGKQVSLEAAVKYPQIVWPTPTSHNAKEGGYPSEHARNTPTLAAQAGGQLNPTWVEWLMGWPLGWTDSSASATAKFREWLASHGAR
tara:strand:+ start:2141 stop:2647 length:507 start_codon:yes stop_codon:yes gene_type:complete